MTTLVETINAIRSAECELKEYAYFISLRDGGYRWDGEHIFFEDISVPRLGDFVLKCLKAADEFLQRGSSEKEQTDDRK